MTAEWIDIRSVDPEVDAATDKRDDIRIAPIEHAPGIGDRLLSHLKVEIENQLDITEQQVKIRRGYYIELE